MAGQSTRSKLLAAIDDIELIGRAIFETRTHPGPDPIPLDALGDLAIEKQAEIDALLKDAQEQAELQKQMDALKAEVEKKDIAIKNLQRGLRSAEQYLSTIIYQANQKLETVRKANTNPVWSEDLIRYAHRISASHGVAAPETWTPGSGDQRRPYPTDLEMRQGFLSQTSTYTDVLGPRGMVTPTESSLPSATASSSSVPWPASSEIPSLVPPHQLDMRGHNKENENIDQSPTDSSSSSSSDE